MSPTRLAAAKEPDKKKIHPYPNTSYCTVLVLYVVLFFIKKLWLKEWQHIEEEKSIVIHD